MSSCVHCAHAAPGVEDLCVWCGRWQDGHMPMCDTHDSTPSTGVCTICMRPVCRDCSSEVHGQLYCRSASHDTTSSDHRLLVTVDSEFEADWIVTHLRQGGITALQASLRDHASAWWFSVQQPVRVFVPADSALRARELLSRFDDLMFLNSERP